MSRLQGKVAIISGSGRGIGRAIAEKFASEGASVVVNDIDEQPAQETVAVIRKSGGNAVACIGDVTAADFGERFVAAALDNFGDLHIIVNNAGYTWDNVIQKMSDEQFQAMLDVHTVAPFRILRAASEHIRVAAKKEAAEGNKQVRKVVNISSISGTRGNPGQINYSSAKASMIGMTQTMAKEWGRYNVTVNCIAYGMIETRLAQSAHGEKPTIEIGDRAIPIGIPAQLEEITQLLIPMGRSGTPQEAAGSVYMLCIPEADYVSGQVIVCGGGI